MIPTVSIPFQKTMLHPVLFISKHGIQIDILRTVEDVALHKRICLLHIADQLFDFHSLGVGVRFGIDRGAGVREVAGALDEVQTVGIAPAFDVVFAD